MSKKDRLAKKREKRDEKEYFKYCFSLYGAPPCESGRYRLLEKIYQRDGRPKINIDDLLI